MSDKTSGPDETGATPSVEADATLPVDGATSEAAEAAVPADEVVGVEEIDEFDGVDDAVIDDAVTDAAGEPPADEPAVAADDAVFSDAEPPTAPEPEPPTAPEPEPFVAADPEPVPVVFSDADPEPEPFTAPEAASTPEPTPEPEPYAPAAAAAAAPEPAVETPADPDAARTARLDEAVERANAGSATSAEPEYQIDYESSYDPETGTETEAATLAAPAVTASEPTPEAEPHTEPVPEPVAAGSVRRETYVPLEPAAAATAVGAATLAPDPLITPPTPVPPQTIYVQAPVPPKSKGNRAFGVLVAAIGAVAFALLYAGVTYLLLLSRGDQGAATDEFVKFLAGPYWALFWVPTIAFFLGFALLAAIINRGPWWTYAVFGLLVGVLVYFSYIGASLLAVQAWTLTFDEAQTFIGDRWLDPFAIVAGVIAREIPIWLGGWIAAHGRTVTERNRVALEAYDRELAAGPRPVA
ncbi:hypothetical protein [Agromyces aureus]|uniref:Uncharacterized protein n=1 Tax=Agromyces aureus TaxID=453304 RepID=A0A191WI14_9MICO|nr:hypothetical protein [Agromyces aureus]ANJ27901.1 hypothetical protein ATC03_15430 [Agromyces aureus]